MFRNVSGSVHGNVMLENKDSQAKKQLGSLAANHSSTLNSQREIPALRHYLELIKTIKFIMNFRHLLIQVNKKREIVSCEVCSTHQKDEKCLKKFTQKKRLKERDHLKEL